MMRVLLQIAGVLLIGASSALAQTWPSQPIKLVVGFTPGTGIDIIARTVGQKLQERLGQPVTVENKPGASGNIGTELVARAKPDGYTLLVTVNTIVMNTALYKSLPFDPVKDLAPISLAAWGSLALSVPSAARIDTVAQLVSAAKAQPGKLNYGSPGIGTPHHLSMELFKNVTATDITHIPYKGTAGAITDLLGGQIDVMFVPIHVALPHVRSGKLKALALGSARRHPTAPDLATLTELGVPGIEVDMWYGFLAPHGTPREVIAKLNAELKAILALPDIQSSFATQGLDPATSTPEEFQSVMERDTARWARVVQQAKITAE
ncbi:MAG: tripartite tricarboxylate transporter substrate binding protein [Betaproteobacteria bacterium]